VYAFGQQVWPSAGHLSHHSFLRHIPSRGFEDIKDIDGLNYFHDQHRGFDLWPWLFLDVNFDGGGPWV
jgi:hypothetical protein